MSDTIRVGDLVAEFLEQVGVEIAFGIISVHNVPLLEAIERRRSIRFVMTRGEMGATHMADGYARVSGKLGVVVTSTGPGAASAVSGLVEARFAGSPVLHVTGQSATRYLERDFGTVHEVADQLGMLRSVSKSAYRVRSADSAFGTLMHAAAEALTPPMGPVSVEIPIDIQTQECARPALLRSFRLPVPAPLAPESGALEKLAHAVVGSRRPILWCGSGARHASGPVARLAKLGVAVATSWNGRGVLPEDDPMSIGPLATLPEFERCYETIDLMLVAGSRLRGHETRDGSMRLPERRIQIDVDTRANGRTYTNTHFVRGDSEVVLAALAQRLEGAWRSDAAYVDEIQRRKSAAIERYRATLGIYAPLPQVVREAMPRDAIWARDISFHQTTWANRIFPIYGPRDSVYSVGAAIGTGMPLGIGAALAASGRKTVAMCGDGGLWLNLGELWTAVQEHADVCFLLMNDGGYGVIRHIQKASYGERRFYDELIGPDPEGLAALAGIPYWRVTRIDELGPNLSAALQRHGPTLVEVDMQSIGPFEPQHQAPSYGSKP